LVARPGTPKEKGAEAIRALSLLLFLLYQFEMSVRTCFPTLFSLAVHGLAEKIVKTGVDRIFENLEADLLAALVWTGPLMAKCAMSGGTRRNLEGGTALTSPL
jgi:hypothetical protein